MLHSRVLSVQVEFIQQTVPSKAQGSWFIAIEEGFEAPSSQSYVVTRPIMVIHLSRQVCHLEVDFRLHLRLLVSTAQIALNQSPDLIHPDIQ